MVLFGGCYGVYVFVYRRICFSLVYKRDMVIRFRFRENVYYSFRGKQKLRIRLERDVERCYSVFGYQRDIEDGFFEFKGFLNI